MTHLTHLSLDKMTAISQTIFSDGILLNESVWISHKISLKFVPEIRIDNVPALVQMIAWHQPGDKPLPEPMMVSLLMHICVTQPQWVKGLWLWRQSPNQTISLDMNNWNICPSAWSMADYFAGSKTSWGQNRNDNLQQKTFLWIF